MVVLLLYLPRSHLIIIYFKKSFTSPLLYMNVWMEKEGDGGCCAFTDIFECLHLAKPNYRKNLDSVKGHLLLIPVWPDQLSYHLWMQFVLFDWKQCCHWHHYSVVDRLLHLNGHFRWDTDGIKYSIGSKVTRVSVNVLDLIC